MLSLDGSAVPPDASKGKSPGKPAEKPASATRSSALDVDEAFRAALEREMPQVTSKLRLYLGHGVVDTRDEASATKVCQPDATGSGIIAVLLGHIQERVVDAFVAFRRAAEFLPVEEAGNVGEETASGSEQQDKRTFSSPEDIRTLLRALC